LKPLHTSIIEANTEGRKDDNIREDAIVIARRCNRVLEMHSKLAKRRLGAADNACLEKRACIANGAMAKDKPADCGWRIAPPSTHPTQQKSAKTSRSTRRNPPKGPQEGEATHAGASKIVSPAIPVAG